MQWHIKEYTHLISFCNFIIRKKSGVVLSFHTTCRFQDHFCYVQFFRFITHSTKMEITKRSKGGVPFIDKDKDWWMCSFCKLFFNKKKRSYVHFLDKMPKGRTIFFFNVHCHYTVFYLSLLHKNPTSSVISKNNNTSLKSFDKVKSPHRENML